MRSDFQCDPAVWNGAGTSDKAFAVVRTRCSSCIRADSSAHAVPAVAIAQIQSDG